MASPSTQTVSILLGDDAGNFTFATSPVSGIGTVAVAVGDFNGDGKTDLAVADENASTISILLQAPAVTLSPSSFNFGDISCRHIERVSDRDANECWVRHCKHFRYHGWRKRIYKTFRKETTAHQICWLERTARLR